MSYSTQPETIKSARKRHRCDWCNQVIESGESYIRWRWYSGGDAGTARLHPECDEAFIRLQESNGGYTEFEPGENPRGCDCGFEPGCKCGWEARELRAKINNALDAAIRRAEAKESQS